MRFLFVDKIVAVQGDVIEGRRAFTPDEPLRYADGTVAPGAASEAIGQLASWLCLARNDFTARPVFLFADAIRVEAPIPVCSDVALSATIAAMDGETFVFSGEAHVGGRLAQRIESCSGYFMPLAELEDPAVTRQRFTALQTEAGLVLEGAAGPAFPFGTLVDEVLAVEPGKELRALKTFAGDLPFYRDHFPRFPVTPIVMLNEMIGAAAQRLFAGQTLSVRGIKDIKIKSFVKPGDVVETRVRAETPVLSPATGTASVRTVAEVLKDGKRILRGLYDYEIMNVAPQETKS